MFCERTAVVAVVAVLASYGISVAQAPEDRAPERPPLSEGYVAEVTSDNVYVRSGPSTNYYTVAKLNAGDRVTVVGDEHGWLQIVPPAGCFSLIDGTFVDRDRDPSIGVVNGNRVNVRTGSTLSRHKYVVQLQLNKGSEVKIIEEHGDGFLRIEPPKGATLWISGEYLQRVPEGLAKTETRVEPTMPVKPATEAPGEPVIPSPTTRPGTASEDFVSSVPVVTKEVDLSLTPAEREARAQELREQLEELEASLKDESAKSLYERDLRAIADKYRPLADQSVDDYTKFYAQTRIAQLEDLATTVESVRQAKSVHGGIEDERQQFAAERANIKTVRIRAEEGLAARGELRESAIYSSQIGPRRYRLVDPARDGARTVCYVEIPQDSDIDVTPYLGRMVGVRATAKRIKTDSVDPVPVLVASEIVLLEGSRSPGTLPSGAGPESGTEPGPTTGPASGT